MRFLWQAERFGFAAAGDPDKDDLIDRRAEPRRVGTYAAKCYSQICVNLT